MSAMIRVLIEQWEDDGLYDALDRQEMLEARAAQRMTKA
jgi:hypothetical protein